MSILRKHLYLHYVHCPEQFIVVLHVSINQHLSMKVEILVYFISRVIFVLIHGRTYFDLDIFERNLSIASIYAIY